MGRQKSNPCHCGLPAHGRGLCSKHYAQALRDKKIVINKIKTIVPEELWEFVKKELKI